MGCLGTVLVSKPRCVRVGARDLRFSEVDAASDGNLSDRAVRCCEEFLCAFGDELDTDR